MKTTRSTKKRRRRLDAHEVHLQTTVAASPSRRTAGSPWCCERGSRAPILGKGLPTLRTSTGASRTPRATMITV